MHREALDQITVVRRTLEWELDMQQARQCGAQAAHHLFEHKEAEPLNEGTLDLANVDRRVE